MEIYNLLGFFGSALVIFAYAPQIHHLIVARCAAGISRQAYIMWFAAAILLLVHAVAISDAVFMILQSINLLATATILFFAEKYKYGTCTTHGK